MWQRLFSSLHGCDPKQLRFAVLRTKINGGLILAFAFVRSSAAAMSKHLQRDIDSLNTELLNISSMVEDMIDKATQALAERRYDLADEVVKADEYVDAHEVHVEEECLKMLALHQPVAVDLRRIATVMKVNNDLERIADHATNIAEDVIYLAEGDIVRHRHEIENSSEDQTTVPRHG